MTRGFLIHEKDSVLTLLESGKTGDELILIGGNKDLEIRLKEDVQAGHKIAYMDIIKGNQVIKHGYPIGMATRDIEAGEWVHTHNIKSNYDEESSGRESGA